MQNYLSLYKAIFFRYLHQLIEKFIRKIQSCRF